MITDGETGRVYPIDASDQEVSTRVDDMASVGRPLIVRWRIAPADAAPQEGESEPLPATRIPEDGKASAYPEN